MPNGRKQALAAPRGRARTAAQRTDELISLCTTFQPPAYVVFEGVQVCPLHQLTSEGLVPNAVVHSQHLPKHQPSQTLLDHNASSWAVLSRLQSATAFTPHTQPALWLR